MIAPSAVVQDVVAMIGVAVGAAVAAAGGLAVDTAVGLAVGAAVGLAVSSAEGLAVSIAGDTPAAAEANADAAAMPDPPAPLPSGGIEPVEAPHAATAIVRPAARAAADHIRRRVFCSVMPRLPSVTSESDVVSIQIGRPGQSGR